MWIVKTYYGESPDAKYTPKKICCDVIHYNKLKYALSAVMDTDSEIYEHLPDEYSVKGKKCEMRSDTDGDEYWFRYENGVWIYLATPYIADVDAIYNR